VLSPLKFDAICIVVSCTGHAMTTKILSSPHDAIVEIFAFAPTTFEIPFH